MNNIEQENEVIENSLMQGYECDKKKKKKNERKSWCLPRKVLLPAT
jgi:hypothetical protein